MDHRPWIMEKAKTDRLQTVDEVARTAKTLDQEGIPVRVVSLPSWELLARQDAAYRESVLPATYPKRLAVEDGVSQGWEKWVGERGEILSIDTFGASAPLSVLQEKFGPTTENIVKREKSLIQQ